GLPAGERDRALVDLVLAETAAVLGRAPGDVEPSTAFAELGLDSRGAVQLRNRLASATGTRLPASIVFERPGPLSMARHLGTVRQGPREAQVASEPGPSGPEDGDAIAIVGMSCRYPGGVESPDDLWRLVAAGVDAVSSFPADRGWDADRLYDPDPGRPG